ncbi:MAG: hypothetical protein ACREO2_04700, partial [Arenimonas sp.]
MDCRRQNKKLLIWGLVFAASTAFAAIATDIPLRAARWLPPDRQLRALTFEPRECLSASPDEKTARSVAIGRTAFRTPLLLGGQSARAGLSCNSCHRNGRGNPDFLFPGLSGAPGTADVTSSLMSSHRGDGIHNPTAIPDLGGAPQTQKISRDRNNQSLEKFIRGLIVEEFDGQEPNKMTLDGITDYVRLLSANACSAPAEQSIRLSNYLSDTRNAMHAAQFALDGNDRATARLMLAGARSSLGMINERYTASKLTQDRQLLQDADLELAAMQYAIDINEEDIPFRITTWLAKMPRWVKILEQ